MDYIIIALVIDRVIHRNRALFIDRDGTINKDCPYCFRPEDLVIYQDALDLIREYQIKGYLIIIITNQSGIGRKYFTIEQMNKFNNYMLQELRKKSVHINAIYYCPHLPEEECNCRKPNDGLIRTAIEDFNIDLKNSIIIGDRDDIEGCMARRLGIDYKLVAHTPKN